ncbi:uncharacterized protein TNCV_4376241 [Trichonephila clavipes]|nr:uncharacterized protein TNCV_4376241 [Trichonephila clavipes]
MAEFGSDNPILGCKFQGCLSSEYEGLNNEDFFLAIQHPLQKEMLKKFSKEIVCVDSTHVTNSYNFKLIAMLVVDDSGEEESEVERERVLPTPNSGNNKNVTRQRSFFSTRKERKISSHLTKPSFEESNSIRKALIDDDDVTIPESDH